MAEIRRIVHVDMDAFYAAVEQRDRPEYHGRPIIVGADPKGGRGRGVVSTASYEARPFGVHSAMPISQAYRLCPQAIFLPVRMAHYQQVSARIFAIFERYTDVVEPLSIDEAFLDVTGSTRLFGTVEDIARRIKQDIRREERLVASVGVAPNKFLAKLASDLSKPDGFAGSACDRCRVLSARFARESAVGGRPTDRSSARNVGIAHHRPGGSVAAGTALQAVW